LHRAGFSLLKLTGLLSDDEVERFYEATCSTLDEWIERLPAELGRRLTRESDRLRR
jgi:hypothetical protein